MSVSSTAHHASINRAPLPFTSESDTRHSTERSHDYRTRDISPLPPATLRSRSHSRNLSLVENESPQFLPQARKHQRSLTELLPQFPALYSGNTISPSRSPIKEISKKEFEDDFMPTLTGDREGLIKVSDKSRGGGLSSWFSGTSAPVPLGVPTGIGQNGATPGKIQRRPTLPNLEGNAGGRDNISPSTPASSTSIFGGFFSPKPKSSPTRNRPVSDELLTLDIKKALFPAGQNENDAFSPASFKNLLMNAEGLLTKMQTALTIRTQMLQELAAEESAKDEEYEEAEIRARSLKTQLQQMAEQLAEKEKLNVELVEALAAERSKRAEEWKAREQSITIVREQAAKNRRSATSDEEDLGIAHASSSSVTPTRGDRSSYGSTDISEDDEPVFSRSMSPTSLNTFLADSNTSVFSTYEPSIASTTELGEASLARVVKVSQPSQRPPAPTRQISTFEKVLQSMSSEGSGLEKEEENRLGMGRSTCGNCEGRDASFAWDTVGLLKVENKGLKEQVARLEEGVSGALDAVLGFGLR